MHHTKLYLGIFGFCVGVAFSFLFFLGVYAALALALIALALLVVARDERAVVLVAIFLCAAALGVLRAQYAQSDTARHTLDAQLGQEVRYEGDVVREPDVRENHTNLIVQTSDVRVLVRADIYRTYEYGDSMSVSGTLIRPENFASEDGRPFNYVAYLAKSHVYYIVDDAAVTALGKGGGNALVRTLLALKHRYLTALRRALVEPYAALAGGITVGEKRALGETLTSEFRTTGIIHIVVLSGYNVMLVADFVQKILSFLPRTLSVSFGAVGIILFAILTGASATTLRASAMALLAIWARSAGRTYTALHALFLVGLGMVLWNPYTLLYDPSFQLSFVATFGLIVFSPRVELWLRHIPNTFHLREILAATIATQFSVLPLILYFMGDLSLVALPVNALVLPSIAPAMLTTFFTGTLGMLPSTLAVLATPFAFLTHAILGYALSIVHFFAQLPFAKLSIPPFSVWLVFIAYTLMTLLAYRLLRKGV